MLKQFDSEQQADDQLITYLQSTVSLQCLSSMERARHQGFFGWWDPNVVSLQELHQQLRAMVEAGEMLNVINYAAMILYRTKILGELQCSDKSN